MPKINDIYDLIEIISVRTPMYVGEWKLSNVEAFISGYSFSLYADEGERIKEFWSDFREFFDWVAQRYDFYESTAGWHNMILAAEMGLAGKKVDWKEYSHNATDEQHKTSVLKFFELIEEFKNSRK